MLRQLLIKIVLVTVLSIMTTSLVGAEEVQVAVAANFTKPMEKIAEAFFKATDHKALLSFGATGKFVEQIKNGAPFQILLAADQKNPIKLDAENLAVPSSRFTYAMGKLVLWSAKSNFVDNKGEILKTDKFQHIAIADPKTAPYGRAGIEVMQKLGLLAALTPKIVQGESIAQAKEFVSSGNAELGFIALAQIIKDGKISEGSSWLVPQDLYSPLYQDVILLKTGENSSAAKVLMDFLKTKPALAIIKEYGYELPAWATMNVK